MAAKPHVSLSEKADGRVISLRFWIRLTPPNTVDPGETDAAMAIGRGLAREAMLLLKNTGEAEGFVVDIEVQQINY